MKKIFRWFWVLAAALPSFGATLPIVWEHIHPFETDARVIRDGSSNMYLFTVAEGPGALLVICRKYNALGQLQWREQIDITPPLVSNADAYIMEVAWSGTRVYAGLTIQNHNMGEFEPKVVGFNTSSGAATQSSFTSMDNLTSIAYGGGQLVALGRRGFNDAVIQYLDPATLASGSDAFLGTDVMIVQGLAMDPSGNAYATYQEPAAAYLVKVTPAGATSWTRTLDAASLTNERYFNLAVDSTTNTLYGIGAAKSGTTDVPLFGVHSTSTGNAVYLGNRTGDTFGMGVDLHVVTGSGVWASTRLNGQFKLFRATGNGSLSWTTPAFAGNTIGGNRFARDIDGNIVFGYSTSTTNTAFRRYSSTDGKLISTFNVASATPMSVANYLTDPAGNFYLARKFDTEISLARAQPADLTIIVNNVVGGNNSVGRITLATPTAATQTWALFSGNPDVATVPATVIVTTGSTTAFFTITTYPNLFNGAVTITARYGGLALSKTLTTLAATLSSITVTPLVSLGGQTPTGTVSLTGKAPAGGRTITLSSNKPDVASVPGSVLIASGEVSASFPVTTLGVNANQGVVLTATLNSISKTVFMAVNAPALVSIGISPSTIQGGQQGTFSMTLDGIAPIGGRSILVFSGAPGIVVLPSSLAVPGGQTTYDHVFNTNAVTSSINITVFATRSGIYKTATVTITP